MARVDERDTPSIGATLSQPTLRVGLDLAGSLEPLGDTMMNLVGALEERTLELVTFATRKMDEPVDGVVRTFPSVLRPLWRRGRGPAIDRFLPPLDVLHVAGTLVPPTKRTPLLVSVDDLRPLRDESAGRWRIEQLRRSVDRGAQIVATSYAARREVQSVLEIENQDIAVAHPAVAIKTRPKVGNSLLVSVTGTAELFLALAPELTQLAQAQGSQVVVLASREAGTRFKAECPDVIVRSRTRARRLLWEARSVLHLSDGARFPSLPVAAFAASIPVVATSTDVNRELLEGAADLVELYDHDAIIASVLRNFADESHRQLLAAAGNVRAVDFSPPVVAERYERLYRDAVSESRTK